MVDKGLKPNGSVFAMPKSAEKASLIVYMVPFNRAMAAKPPSFHLPSVEVLALVILGEMTRLADFLPGLHRSHQVYSCVVDALQTLSEGSEGLYMCHIDLSNRSLHFPARYHECLCIRGAFGEVLSFHCLLFGWKYIPILC